MIPRLLLAVLLLAAPVLADPLAEARDRVANGEHESAIPFFERHIQAAPPSAALHFEFARALEAAGEEARAALEFRRTLVLDPAFAPAREALRAANIQLGLAAPRQDWRTSVATRIPPDLLANLGALLFWIGAFLFAATLFFAAPRAWKYSSLLCVLLGLGSAGLAWMADPRVREARDAMVLSPEGSVLYRTPSEEDSQKLTTLGQGSVLKILSVRGRWFHGELPGGQRGWFLQKGVEMVVPPA